MKKSIVESQRQNILRQAVERTAKGQALMEFTLSLPILLLILIAAYMVGAAMYTGANASTAVRSALEKKYDYADSETAMNELLTTVNGYNLGTFQITGSNVDSLALAFTGNETPVIVAQKSVSLPLFPTFNFVATQGINGDLIQNNTAPFSAETDLPFNPAVPQLSSAINPATYLFDPTTVPTYVPIDEACNPTDLSGFASSVNSCGSVICTISNALLLVNDHTSQHMTPQDACTVGSFHDPTDVTFDSSTPVY